MGRSIRIGGKAELPAPGEAREFLCGTKTLCVANLHGALSALDNICPHRGGPLGQGVIEGDKLVCPWHGWQVHALTGAYGPAGDKVVTYPIRLEGEDVLVEMP